MDTDSKLVLCGQVIHSYQYAETFKYGSLNYKKSNNFDSSRSTYTDASVQSDRKDNIYRTKRNLKYTLQSNAFQFFDTVKNRFFNPLFITYTFRENIKDLQTANKFFTHFNKRLNYEIFNTKQAQLKYLTVPEFQKRGAVHYHTVYFNFPFTPQIFKVLSYTWGQGYIFSETIKDTPQLTAYLTKYITKEDYYDQRYKENKRYFCSQGLKKPVIIYNPISIQGLKQFLPDPSYSKEFIGYNGLLTKYQCYILPVDNTILQKDSINIELSCSRN